MGGFEVDGSDPASKKNVEERIDKQKALAAARPKGEGERDVVTPPPPRARTHAIHKTHARTRPLPGELGKCEELLHELDAPDLSFDPTGAWLRLESTQTFVDPPTKLGRAVPHIGAAAGNVHADYIAAADAADATAGRLRFVCISDTHGGHRGTHLPRGDVLVHINFCNEKLQFHFNEHIFRLEQEVYAAEGVDVPHTDFKDNQPTLDLLELKGTGIFSMCDEEVITPKGMETKCHKFVKSR